LKMVSTSELGPDVSMSSLASCCVYE
jgi:hypothetical protein